MRYKAITVLASIFLLATCNNSRELVKVEPVIESVHPYLKPYYEEFLELTGYANKEEIIVMEFSKLMPYGVLGIAIGMDVDNVIYIKINADHWHELSENQRYVLLMHELAHDALNWEHESNILMETPMSRFIGSEYVDKCKKTLRDYAKR